MPFFAVALFSAGVGAYTWYKGEHFFTPAATADTVSSSPSPLTLGLYAAGGLGLFFLYKKAMKA